MKQLNYADGLQIYGVYNFEKYPDWDVLCADITTTAFYGFAFSKDGEFITGVYLKLPIVGEKIGYVYMPKEGFALYLKAISNYEELPLTSPW